MSWPIWGGLLGKQRVFLIKLTQITKLSRSKSWWWSWFFQKKGFRGNKPFHINDDYSKRERFPKQRLFPIEGVRIRELPVPRERGALLPYFRWKLTIEFGNQAPKWIFCFTQLDSGFDEVEDIRKIIENQQFFHLQVLRSLRKEIYNCWHGWEMRFGAFLNIQILSVKKYPSKNWS